MRILHITSHLNVGGVTSYLLSLARTLHGRGHHVIIASGGGQLEAQAAAHGPTHWRVPLHTSAELSPQVFWATQQLVRRVRQEPVDLIHAHTRVAQVVASRLSHRLKIPYVTTWHGFFHPNVGRRLWPCTGDLTIAISEPVRHHLIHTFHVPAPRIRLIFNGVDVDHFARPPDARALQAYRIQWGIPDGRPIIGSVGRLASGGVKGFDLLLAAARHVDQVHVVIAGDGPRRSWLEGEATRLDLSARVHFVGTTADVRLPLAVMDVFVFPVRWQEGFGLSLIEAMAAGKPVVASQIGAASHIIEHGRSGWLVPLEDPAALAHGIRRLLGDSAMADQVGRTAQARVREAFSLDHMVDQVETVYRELLRGEGPGRARHVPSPMSQAIQ